MTAAARRDVGNTPAAKPRHEPHDRVRLGADLHRGIGRAAAAGRIQVKGQHPPGSRGGIVDRHRARRARRRGGQRPGVPGGVRAAAVARDSDLSHLIDALSDDDAKLVESIVSRLTEDRTETLEAEQDGEPNPARRSAARPGAG